MREPRNETNRCSVRALLADDHTLFRQALATLLASRGGVEVVGHVPNGDGLVALTRREKPDVVFTELRTPVEQAKEGLLELLSVSHGPRVVVVSQREDPLLARELVRLGVSAYVAKRASVEHLLEALRVAVSDGEGAMVVCSPRDQPPPVEGEEEKVPSEREMEILLLVARGLSNRRIASLLYIADTTVKRHLANLYQKIGVRSRSEAVRKALAEGWIVPRDFEEN